ncbi:hypothetical protein OJ998_01050 [Solirubrobacter taibaiensis]|nr:hypothetical protein [Solirubrobacter taibaiensis]
MAAEKGREEIQARFCVVQHSALEMLNERNPKQLIAAQRRVDDEMLSALESMIKSARAGKLEGAEALAQACVAW